MRHDILHEFPDPRTEAAWREFLSRLEFPSYYNAPEYFHEPFWADKRPFCILAREGDRVAAALTGLHDGHQVLCGLPSRPQVAVDPDADGTAALEALVEGLGVEAGSAKLIAVYSWHSLDLTPFVARGFRSRQLQGRVRRALGRLDGQ